MLYGKGITRNRHAITSTYLEATVFLVEKRVLAPGRVKIGAKAMPVSNPFVKYLKRYSWAFIPNPR